MTPAKDPGHELRLTSPSLLPTLPDAPTWVLSVDGMAPEGPNLSHWPGNRTPERWKADLSTGICLNFAAAPEAECRDFLAGATMVLNDHYDTDGFLSLLCALRPQTALSRVDALLAAAATGDYQSYQSEKAFAVDRIVLNLAKSTSPVASEFAGVQGEAKDLARYRWLIEHAEAVLDDPTAESFLPLFGEELAVVRAQLEDPTIRDSAASDLGLAAIRSPGSVHRMVLNTRAARCFRVLHCQETATGTLIRFHDRTESWFEVKTFVPPPRRDLSGLRDRLEARESTDSTGQWCLDSDDEPVPELYHGLPSEQEYGAITRTLTPSSMNADEVEELFAAFFAKAGDDDG